MRTSTHIRTGLPAKTTMEELATYMRGWRGYFGLLRNARGADRPHSLGPIATAGRSVAPMENPTAPPRGTHRKWGLRVGCKEHGRQNAWLTSRETRWRSMILFACTGC